MSKVRAWSLSMGPLVSLSHPGLRSQLCSSSRIFAAMQFGQLLTHLDTTQQMIAASLKDNATLLAQVCQSLCFVYCHFFPLQNSVVLQPHLRGFCLRPLNVSSFFVAV